MNWIDLLLLIVVGASVLTGLAAGFARVGVGFIAMIVGLFCGFWFYGIVAAYVLDYVSSRAIANLVGFFVIFAGVLLLGALAGRILRSFSSGWGYPGWTACWAALLAWSEAC